MTTIKYHAGETVYWLSMSGFARGTIKTVYFIEEMMKSGKTKRELFYYVTQDIGSEYCGDKVAEYLVFTDYDAMLEYYKNNPQFVAK